MKYSELIEKIERGASFSIDFRKRELQVDKKLVDLNSIEWESRLKLYPNENLNDLIPLYTAYKHSIPSEKSESKSRRYFKALPIKELSDDDFMYGMPREIARFHLEMALLRMIFFNHIKWEDETMGTWFWQSPDDKDFIILKDWVVG